MNSSRSTAEHTFAQAPSWSNEAPAVEQHSDPAAALEVVGQVIDDDEVAVADATVVLGTEPRSIRQTGVDGIFKFEGLKGASYQIGAHAGDRVAGPFIVEVSAQTGPITLRLRRVPGVRIRVVDGASRAALSGVTVQVLDAGVVEATTDAGGLALLAGLAAGFHEVRFVRTGYATTKALVEVGEVRVPDPIREVKLQRGAALAGRVADASGQPAPNARVRLEQNALPGNLRVFSEQTVTDEQGRFTFEAVPGGKARVVAEHVALGFGKTAWIQLDGTSPASCEVRLDAGTMLRGRVITSGGEGLRLARVRIDPVRCDAPLTSQRETRSDDHGDFALTGLPRCLVQVLAIHETASSRITLVDLERPSAILTLIIDGDSAIEGLVLSRAGAPVSDVQVAALPDGSPSQTPGVDPALLGLSTALTDAAGHFALRGLGPGAYRVRASSSSTLQSMAFWADSGVVATSGAKNLRIVLEDPGIIRGRVAFANGEAPEVFTVGFSSSAAASFAGGKGAFALQGVPAGTHTLAVNGPGLEPTFKDDIVVRSGQEVNVGTIHVGSKRKVQGRVVRTDGSPIADASVIVAASLVSDGSTALVDQEGAVGRRETRTARDGTFVVDDVSRAPLLAIAEHPSEGRTLAKAIPAGIDSPIVELVMKASGRLEGRVTQGRLAITDAIVVATRPDTNRGRFVATADDSGQFHFDSLAAGDYVVTAMSGGEASRDTQAADKATVRSGVTERADIDLPDGEIDLTVTLIERTTNRPVPNAQAYLLSGIVRAVRAGELETAIAERGIGTSYTTLAARGAPAHFRRVAIGRYSLCVVGIFADLTNPATSQRVQRTAALLPVACIPLDVTSQAGREQQTIALLP